MMLREHWRCELLRRPATEEQHSPRADGEDDERLCGDGFNEPASLKFAVPSMKYQHHERRGREIKERADRSKQQHEATDIADIPVPWRSNLFAINPIPRNG